MNKNKSQNYNVPANEISRARTKAQSYQAMIALAARKYGVAPDVMISIAYNESSFNPHASGAVQDTGLFQVTPPVLTDYNRANKTNITIAGLFEPSVNADVAAWKLSNDFRYFNGNLEKTIKAYNTGRGGINSAAARLYWERFKRTYFGIFKGSV